MKILAFECSSPRASMAVVVDGQGVAEVQWDTGLRREHRLFEELDILLKQSGVVLQDVDAFAVGRGPGNFTGMRVSLAAAQAMALPGSKPCISLSSGSCQAAQWLAHHPGPLAVVGDARRGKCWYGVFSEVPPPGREAAWTLCPYEELVSSLPVGCTVLSAEVDRLKRAVPGIYEAGMHLLQKDDYPSATALGERAAVVLESEMGGEPSEPLYMHPAI